MSEPQVVTIKPKTPLTAFDIIQSGWKTFRKVLLLQGGHISFFGMVLPYLAWDFLTARSGLSLGEELIRLTDLAQGDPASISIMHFITTIYGFLRSHLGGAFFLSIIALTAYLALVKIALAHATEKSPPPLGQNLKQAFIKTMPRGLFLSFLLLILGIMGQIIAFPMIFLSALSLMAPILMMVEGTGALRSFGRAISIRYAKTAPMGRFPVAMIMISLGGFLFLALMLVFAGHEYLMFADQWLKVSGGVWTFGASLSSPSWFYYLCETLKATALCLCFIFHLCLVVALYARIRSLRIIV